MSSPSPLLVAMLAGAAALSVGLVLGAMGPQAEARRLREEVALLESRPCNRGIGRDIASVLQGAGRAVAPAAAPPRAAPTDAPPPDGDWQPVGEGDGTRISLEVDGGPEQPPDADIAESASVALALRRAQVRAALVEQAAPSPDQLDAIDAVVGEMNASLEDLAADLAARLQAGEPLERRDGMEVAIEALDLFVATEDAMRASLSPEQLAALQDDVLDPFAYVDPAVLDAFMGLDP